jgi:NAD(P)-dependent dehydrogenase (short-subunit alcohol dehydrogenase family)
MSIVRLRILAIGGEGAVGKAALSDLAQRHEIVTAGRSSGTHRVDVMNEDSVKALFGAVGPVDAVIVTTGHGHFGPVATMTPQQFRKGVEDKLMGQINVALLGLPFVKDGGCITLTSGCTNRDFIRLGANAASMNGAIDDFVRSAAFEMPRGVRINAVSPGLLDVSATKYTGFFPGQIPVPSSRVGFAFTKAVEGFLNGKVLVVD